jgi:hypothetical protein
MNVLADAVPLGVRQESATCADFVDAAVEFRRNAVHRKEVEVQVLSPAHLSSGRKKRPGAPPDLFSFEPARDTARLALVNRTHPRRWSSRRDTVASDP